MTIVILAGPSGSGKTTTLLTLEERAKAAGASLGGVACRAVFEGGRKRGIAWRRAGSGSEEGRLAWAETEAGGTDRPAGEAPRREPRIAGGYLRFGMWRFDPGALAEADEAARAFLFAPPGDSGARRLCLVDELGPLELEWGLGFTATLKALDAVASADDWLGACVVSARPDIADRLEARWPSALRLDLDRGAEPEPRTVVEARAARTATGILRAAGLA